MKFVLPAFLALIVAVCAEPVPLIFDTDIGNDVDDVMALALIHSLERRGACKLLAVTVSKDHPKAAPFVDLVNTFYGRGDVPIGMVQNGTSHDEGKFLKLADDVANYPHDLKSGADAPPAISLLRKTLAGQPDASVTIAQVGFFTNLARLLDSPADEFSPLAGRELIAKKVKQLSVMAGAFQTIGSNNAYIEYNVYLDIPAVQKLAKEWPTAILWSGFEIGIAAPYPAVSIEKDFGYVSHHPVKESYDLYVPARENRPTWDLSSVLAVVHPDRDYFGVSGPGQVITTDEGVTRFKEDPKGRDRFLTINPLQAERVREAFVQLVNEPPVRR